jgi:hypothetical protein
MRPWLLAVLCGILLAADPGDPRSEGAAWLGRAAARLGFRFTGRPEHLLWGRDPVTGAWEALAILRPPPASTRGRIVRLHRDRSGRWHLQRVGEVQIDAQMPGRLHAMDAESLAEYGGCPALRPGQDPKVPAAPLEFHYEPDTEDLGLPSPADIFHPRFGLATVVNAIVDDRKDPSPPGQAWSTHGRGESTDLPLSAFHKGVKVLDRWRGRVWFRVNGQLYALCEDAWQAPWPKVEPRDPSKD